MKHLINFLKNKLSIDVDCNDKNASDSNDGSKEHPFKTIQRAANEAVGGTHVWIMPGVYRECVSPMHGGDGPERINKV